MDSQFLTPQALTISGYTAALALSAVAAVTDSRTGQIPNWLTLPPLATFPMLALLCSPWQGVHSLVGLVVCALVPLLMFRLGAMGGGDVKLFAALGTVLGAELGLEVQVLSLAIIMLYGILRLAWQGGLGALLFNSALLCFAWILPEHRRPRRKPHTVETVRMGASILIACTLLVVGRVMELG